MGAPRGSTDGSLLPSAEDLLASSTAGDGVDPRNAHESGDEIRLDGGLRVEVRRRDDVRA